MANYRRELSIDKQKQIHRKYKNHRDAEGGIFKPDKRRKLLGVKGEKKKVAPENLANFWSDVRKYVKNGLIDLQLIAEVAHPDQLKEMFQLIPLSERREDKSKTSIVNILDAIFEEHNKLVYDIEKDGTRFPRRSTEVDDSWKIDLAAEIVGNCLKFYMDSGLVTSKAHERLIEEVTDMLGSEYGHVINRELSLQHIMQFS